MMKKLNWQSKVVSLGFLARNNYAPLVMRCRWRRDKICHAMLAIFEFGFTVIALVG